MHKLFLLIRIMDYFLVTIFISIYIFGITKCLIKLSISSLATLYPLILSMYYYLTIILSNSVMTDGNEICDYCKLVHHEDSRYCLYCSRCFYRKDHHCPWLGTCIYSENLKDFFGLLVSSVISLFLCGFIFELCFLSVISLILLSYTFFICYVWGNNCTTREFFYKEEKKFEFINLYNMLFEKNVYNVLLLFLPVFRINIKFKKREEIFL